MPRPIRHPATGYLRRAARRNTRPRRDATARPDTTPLDYALAVMRDPAAALARRDRMAILAFGSTHGRRKAAAEAEQKPVVSHRFPEVIEDPEEWLRQYEHLRLKPS